MKFYLRFFFPVLLGFLVSCSSGKQYYSGNQNWGGFYNSSTVTTSGSEKTADNGLQNASHQPDGPVYASTENIIDIAAPSSIITPLQGSKIPAAEPKNSLNKKERKQLRKLIKQATIKAEAAAPPGPGSERTVKFGLASVIAGVLAFAPFVLGWSLLLAIPFAIIGIICGRVALDSQVGNYRRRGVALAKAGLLMSSVVGVVLVIMGIMSVINSN